MVLRKVQVGDKEVTFRASAMIPRLYRARFRRDIMKDMVILAKGMEDNDEEESDMPLENLEIFENVAYVMARHGGGDISDTIEEWLDEFDVFSIFQILPTILEMWNINMEQTSEAKKKGVQRKGK